MQKCAIQSVKIGLKRAGIHLSDKITHKHMSSGWSDRRTRVFALSQKCVETRGVNTSVRVYVVSIKYSFTYTA